MKVMATLIGIISTLTSCTFSDEPGICPYNVRLEYHYASAPTSDNLGLYVDAIRQYLFDADGRLVTITDLQGDSLNHWQGMLPAGRYTLVTWGNPGDERPLHPFMIGETLLQEAGITATLPGVPPNYRGNTARLYFGTRKLEVKEGVTLNTKIYITHAHASLFVTVRWGKDVELPLPGNFTLRLRSIPAEYSFESALELPLPDDSGAFTIPRTGRAITQHSARAGMSYENEVTGEIVSFRFNNDTHPLLSLYRDNQQVIKEIDLERFFRKLATPLDENTEQEFRLLLLVEKDKIIVSEMEATDWEEGGGLG